MNQKMISFFVFGITLVLVALFSIKFESVELKYVNAQNENNATLKQQAALSDDKTNDASPLPLTTPTTAISNVPATLLITKVIRCDSNLGLPSDDAVCQFVLANVHPSQFTITVSGNNSNPSSFQGSLNGTKVSLYPGKYAISETLFDTTNLENQLGETTTGTVSTAVSGDCTSQFNYLDVFQNATGTITSGQYQRCEIIDTIGITSGVVPGGPFGPV
ncbi:MAG TPA: hypothetical protein VGC75_07415 [Candidatus Nitrosocosmicus sp.]